MSLKTYLSFTVLFGILSASFTGAQPPAERHDSLPTAHAIAAVVDGHSISTSEVEKSALHRYGQEILDGLIDNYLIEQESERLHVAVSEAEIDHQVQALVEAIRPKTLAEGLQQHHQTVAELRDDFRRRLLALKLASISAPPGHFVHAHVILSKITPGDPATRTGVDALTRVADLQRKIAAGTSFEDLASQYSQDPLSKARRGDIGIVFQGSAYDLRVVEAALPLKAGQILDKPLQTPSGYYLIKASSTDSDHPADEDPLYSEAKWQYEMRQGTQNLPSYLRALRTHANIRLYLNP